MSSRTGFVLATLLLLLGALLRSHRLPDLPPGLNEDEYATLRITESQRAGQIAVFYDQAPAEEETRGREGFYSALLAVSTLLTGGGPTGYRALPFFISMLTLAMVYALASRLCGTRGGLAALALLTVSLWPVLLGRSIGPVTLLPFLAAALMLALAYVLTVPERLARRVPGTIAFTGLGLVAGLGFYVHPAQFWLLAGALLFIFWLTRSQGPLTLNLILSLFFSLLIMAAVLLPYGLSTLRLSDISGIGRIFGDYDMFASPPLQSIVNNIGGVLFIGDASPLHNLPGRPLFDLLSGLVIVLGLMASLRSRHHPRFGLPLIFLLALAPAALLSNESPDFAQLSLLLPLLALFFGFGVVTLANSLGQAARFVPVIALVVLPGFNIAWTSNDLFSVWAGLPETMSAWNGRIGQLASHVDRSAGSLPTVVCIPSVDPEPAAGLSDAWRMLLLLHDRSEALRYADCRTSLVLANGGERQQIILPDSSMLADMHPLLRDWLQRGLLPQDPALPQDSVFTLDVGDLLGDKVGNFTTTAPVRLAPEAPGGAENILPPVSLDGNLTFLGYEPSGMERYQHGDVITSVTWWRVDGPLPPDLHLFTHVMHDPAMITSQNDKLSVLAASLHPRDIFIQVTYVRLPVPTPAGNYLVSIGAYRQGDEQRLSVLQDGELRGTRLFLNTNVFTVGHKEG